VRSWNLFAHYDLRSTSSYRLWRPVRRVEAIRLVTGLARPGIQEPVGGGHALSSPDVGVTIGLMQGDGVSVEVLERLLRDRLPAVRGRWRVELAGDGVEVGSDDGLTVRLRVCDDDTGEVMEQPVVLVPGKHGRDADRLSWYMRAWLEALPLLLATVGDRMGGWCPPPEALCFPQALLDPRAKVAEDFHQLFAHPRSVGAWEVTKAKDAVRAFGHQVGLADHADALADLRRTGITVESALDRSLNVVSRLGGVPDMPPDAPWPHRDGWPMTFLAQVDLSEAHRFDDDSLLPPVGLLQFFADLASDMAWDESAAMSAVRVAVQPDVNIVPASPPAGVDVLPARVVTMSVDSLSLPPLDSPFYSQLLGRAAEVAPSQGRPLLDFLNEFHPPLDDDDRPRHRLLGYADPIQDDPWAHCARADGRLPAKEWQLLAQFDSEPDAMFGDDGMIYIFIPPDALHCGDFTRARGVWQTH